SGFAKVAYAAGAATLFGDVQARSARFEYTPDAQAGIRARDIDWRFLNPKVGLTYQTSPALSLYASYGRNSREPARLDMLARADNLDSATAASVGPFSRVKPETVHDIEAGLRYADGRVTAQANVYSMNFRNEIAPIGEL